MKNIAISFFALIVSSQSIAQTISWTGNGPTDNWNEPLNWNPQRVPLDTDDVKISGASLVVVTESSDIQSLTKENSEVQIQNGVTLTYQFGHN